VLHAPGVSTAYGLPNASGSVQTGGATLGQVSDTKPIGAKVQLASSQATAFSVNYHAGSGDVQFELDGTGSVQLPTGTTAQRPTNLLAAGSIRYNTTTTKTEVYNGSAWVNVGAESGTITSLGLSATASRLIGRATASDGVLEEIPLDSTLQFDSGNLGISDDAISAVKLAASAVDTDALATNAVTTVKVTDGNITTDKLADSAVTEAKLANTHVLRADRQVGNPYATLSTTTITQWYSFTIPGDTLATRSVRVLAHGTLKQNSGSAQNFRAVVRLGGTDIHEAAGSISDDADDAIWRMELELSYRANRNQFVSGTWRVSGQYNSADGISNIFGITKDGIWGNDAVGQNDTGDLALSFHQKWDTSTTSSDFKVYAVTVEYV